MGKAKHEKSEKTGKKLNKKKVFIVMILIVALIVLVIYLLESNKVFEMFKKHNEEIAEPENTVTNATENRAKQWGRK